MDAPPPVQPPLPRLLLLCAGDPESERAFSGSARSLFQALEALGCVVGKANVLGITDPFKRGSLPLRLLRKLDRLSLEERYRWSAAAFRRNSRRAEAHARNAPPFDACLMYGTTYLPRLGVPTYCYFDATFAQVHQAGAWGVSQFSHRRTRWVHAFQREVYENCTGIFPRTEWAARSVISDFGIAPAKVTPAGAGPNHVVAPLPHAPYDNQTILFIGGEFARKGGPLLLEAFRIVRKSLPGARLRIVGAQLHIEEPGVEVLGRFSKDTPEGMEALLRCYSEAAVFCIMSHFEPFGIVVLEAANSRVPCVAPDRFAFPETIQDGVTGRLVPGYEPEPLAQLLVELLRQPETLRAMGEAGHSFVRDRWTWEAAAQRILVRIQRDLRQTGEAQDA
jgi:alpha-maltose-1-phosphate synthase